ncbi:rubredoxin [Acidiferrobacter sp. SPIII_3]|jgi:rubredoxin|nr:rubredoxin [Acidiferrobacter sp. SPIII_3]AWP22039.1 rubredoxin [Acidiferrobacter sp. SPIII_3]
MNADPPKVYMCVICGFLYEEEKGLPEHGIPAGTRWKDVPENWTCPDCGATKDEFEMIEI